MPISSGCTAYAVDKSRVIVDRIPVARSGARRARRQFDRRRLSACCSRTRGRSRPKSPSQWLSGEIDNLRKKVAEAEAQGRGFPLQVEPVRRHQQHHAVEPADGRAQHPAQQCARAEVRCRIQGAADPRDAAERQADRGLRGAQFRIDPPAVRAARDAAGAAGRAVVDAARQPSAHQGTEGAARRSRQPDPRRGRQDLAARSKTTRASPAAGSRA